MIGIRPKNITDNGDYDGQDDEHLDGWEAYLSLTADIVVDEIPRAQEQLPKGIGH